MEKRATEEKGNFPEKGKEKSKYPYSCFLKILT
jgi:hypothetical protein